MQTGEIWRHSAYYSEQGRPKPKFLLILGFVHGDLVVRTLTSREHLRSQDVCSHDPIKPHYALGILNPPKGLDQPTWLDLMNDDDIEPQKWDTLIKDGFLTPVMILPNAVMCPLLQCAYAAPGTTKNQGNAMLTSRQALNC